MSEASKAKGPVPPSVLHRILLEGGEFLKFGRHGRPRYKRIVCTPQGELKWLPIVSEKGSKKTGSSIWLKDVNSVIRGKHSKVFSRRVARDSSDQLCFTVSTSKRTLDLQAASLSLRDIWVDALSSATIWAKKGRRLDKDESSQEAPVRAPRATPEIKMTRRERELVLFLDEGAVILKHGRKGSPKQKWVNIGKGKLFWGDPKINQRPSLSGVANFLKLAQVVEVVPGKATRVFSRSTSAKANPQHCFSVITKDRSLDLETKSEEDRKRWIEGIQLAVNKAKEIRRRKQAANPSANKAEDKQPPVPANGEQEGEGRMERSSTWTATTLQQHQQSSFADDLDHKHDDERQYNSTMPNFTTEDPEDIEGAESFDEGKLDAHEALMLHFVDRGTTFVKYGRSGAPKPKFVNVTQGKVFWAPAASGRTSGQSNSKSHIFIVDVTGILPGKITKVFGRRNARSIDSNLCFSIVTRRRTLDLQAQTREERDKWVEALKFLVKRTKVECDRQLDTQRRLNEQAYNTITRSELVKHHAAQPVPGRLSRGQPGSTWSSRDEQQLQATRQAANTIQGSSNTPAQPDMPSSPHTMRRKGSRPTVVGAFDVSTEQKTPPEVRRSVSAPSVETVQNLSYDEKKRILAEERRKADAALKELQRGAMEESKRVAAERDAIVIHTEPSLKNDPDQFGSDTATASETETETEEEDVSQGGDTAEWHGKADEDGDMTETDPGPPEKPPTASDWEDTEAEYTEALLTEIDESSQEENDNDSDASDDLGEVYEQKSTEPPAASYPPEPSDKARLILAEVSRARGKLKNVQSNWSARSAALVSIKSVISGRNLPSIEGWWQELDELQEVVCVQLADLRSAIVKDSCQLLIALATELGHTDEFIEFLNVVLPVLFQRLHVQIKVISETCDICIIELLTRSRWVSPYLVPQILMSATTSPEPVVRARCAQYLTQILVECSDNPAVDDYILELANVIAKLINDPDKDTRTSARRLYLSFDRLWPNAAAKLLEQFGKVTSRNIANERPNFKRYVKQMIQRIKRLYEEV